MSRRIRRRTLFASLVSICLIATIRAAGESSRPRYTADCQFVSFKVILNTGADFEREFGGGLLFRLRDQKDSGWLIDVVPAEANTKDYVYPVNLPLRANSNQTLGAAYGETLKSSLAHPHEMNFLLSRPDYDRISALIGNVLFAYKTSDPDKALSDYTNAVDRAAKGWLKVTIASYKTDPKTGTPTHIKLHVQITTPTNFQFAPRMNPFPGPCHS
jgi:hypothetical protein